MKTQQFLLLQQKYQQASSQAQGQTGLQSQVSAQAVHEVAKQGSAG